MVNSSDNNNNNNGDEDAIELPYWIFKDKEEKGKNNANNEETEGKSSPRSSPRKGRFGRKKKRRYEDYDPDSQRSEESEVYIVRQSHGYCSIFFSVVQTVILALMMWQCGIAPMNINPSFGPYPDALSEWGGKNSILILEDNEWWRLITPILLHAGVIHLLCNVAVQLETGLFFEKEWGSAKWLIIYLTSALGSSAFSVVIMPNAVSVGSSGAVMGLFGGKLAEVILKACESNETKQQKIGHQVRKEQCAAVSCSVIVVMLFSFIPYVDWAAHLGGVISGFVVGLALFSNEISFLSMRIFWAVLGTGAAIALFALMMEHMYSGGVEAAEELRDVCGYYKEHFDDYECNCMREEYMEGQDQGGR